MTNEFIFGPSQNKLSLDATDPNAGTLRGIGLNFATPFPYSDAQFVNITFGGVNNQNFGAITNYDIFPYRNSNTTFDFIDNVSKVFAAHTAKAGIFVQRSRKDQGAGNSLRINFSGNNASDPNNTGHPYANALLGNFDSYQQPTSGLYQGQYRSTNIEWFVQDNWKFNKRLTLDYGMRFVIMQPQFDARNQASFFNPTLYNPANAVKLYRRDVSGSAFDPANPTKLLPSYLVGRIVPGTGDPFDGIGQSAKGYLRGGIENRGVHYGPSVGFAYDVFGDSKTIVRGGYRLGYDRVSGNNLIFRGVPNPPVFVNPTFNFGNLNTVGSSTGQIALAPFGVVGADPTGKLPSVQSFSLQLQRDLGFGTVASVAYVGTLSHHLTQQRNLNYIPYGTTFTKAAQDPSRYANGIVPDSDSSIAQVYKDAGFKFDGSKALPVDFLRPYIGYQDIPYVENVGSANYHSMQVTVQRNARSNLSYGLAYTWSKAMDTANGDGDYSHPFDTRGYDYRLASFDRTHVLAINYIYNLPSASRRLGDNLVAKFLLDGWEVSGISQFATGVPAEIGLGINGVGNLGQRITGSYTEGPRILCSPAIPSPVSPAKTVSITPFFGCQISAAWAKASASISGVRAST